MFTTLLRVSFFHFFICAFFLSSFLSFFLSFFLSVSRQRHFASWTSMRVRGGGLVYVYNFIHTRLASNV